MVALLPDEEFEDDNGVEGVELLRNREPVNLCH
jgi:hypothetical protein